MTFPINTLIPAQNNDPADDQPLMQTNFSNINSYLKVDHTDPSALGAGQHKLVTINAKNLPVPIPGPNPTSPQSVVYTANGSASAASTQLIFWNSDQKFLLSGLRAFASVSINGAGFATLNNKVNVSTAVANVGAKTLTLALVSGAVFGADVVPIITTSPSPVGNTSFTWTYAAAPTDTLTITWNDFLHVSTVTVAIYQF